MFEKGQGSPAADGKHELFRFLNTSLTFESQVLSSHENESAFLWNLFFRTKSNKLKIFLNEEQENCPFFNQRAHRVQQPPETGGKLSFKL